MKGSFDFYYASIQWVTYRYRTALQVRYALLLISFVTNVTEIIIFDLTESLRSR